MQIVKKKYTIGLVLFVIALGVIAFLPLDLPYKVKSVAVVRPALEWELGRNTEGSLSSLLRNNLTGSVESYGNTEFRRGDVMKFELNPTIEAGGFIQEGDTIGFLYSNEERMKLIQLLGELEVLESQLSYYKAGQKPEDIESAEREVLLAEQELATQRKLMNRSENLKKDSVISMQQYEIDQNELQVKEMNKNLAEAKLKSIMAGDKPEQIQLVQTQIAVAKQQISQVRERLDYLTVISPISGIVVLERKLIQEDILVRVLDTSSFIGIAPILLSDRDFIEPGSEVSIITKIFEKHSVGKVYDFNNVSEIINGEPAVYFTIQFEQSHPSLIPGNLIEIEVKGVTLNPRQYVDKTFNSPG